VWIIIRCGRRNANAVKEQVQVHVALHCFVPKIGTGVQLKRHRHALKSVDILMASEKGIIDCEILSG
jgi:hypothetical protein